MAPAEALATNGHAVPDLLTSLQPLFSRHDPADGSWIGRSSTTAIFEECNGRPAPGETPDSGELQEAFASSEIPALPSPPEDYYAFLQRTLLPHLVNLSSPRCAGHMSGATPDFHQHLAGFLVRTNQNLVKFEASKALSLVERQTLAMLHRLVYDAPGEFYDLHIHHPKSTLGIGCSGGGMANLMALWCARNRAFPALGNFSGIEQKGLPAALSQHGVERAVILTSRMAHYSVDKAAAVLGLGSDGVIRLAADARGRLDVDSLRHEIAECGRRRWRIIAIVGVAGATETGSIDPLDAIAAVASDRGIHFHVDAAWGAPLLLAEEMRTRLRGIEEADSVTVDGHKMLFAPVGVSALLLRDPAAAAVLEKTADYMLRQDSEDLGKRSVEGSRNGSVLYLHAALKTFGRAGFRRMLEHSLANARIFVDLIRQRPGFELLLEPETNIVLYRYVPPSLRIPAGGTNSVERHEAINAVNERLQTEQFVAGRTYVSRTRLQGFGPFEGRSTVALRAVLAHPLTNREDLVAILDDQERIANEL